MIEQHLDQIAEMSLTARAEVLAGFAEARTRLLALPDDDIIRPCPPPPRRLVHHHPPATIIEDAPGWRRWFFGTAVWLTLAAAAAVPEGIIR
jgi:hypothetical protein